MIRTRTTSDDKHNNNKTTITAATTTTTTQSNHSSKLITTNHNKPSINHSNVSHKKKAQLNKTWKHLQKKEKIHQTNQN